MEVTRENFSEVLKELDSVIENATFLAIDGEFTGLNSGPAAKQFDTPAQYYQKLRAGCMDFLMIQFGLSTFTHNAKTDKYSQRSYNFYIFPRPLNRSAPDCRFMCQASSIDFLASQGFDFNKLFYHGIPYLTVDEEKEMNKKFEDRQKVMDDGQDIITIPEDDRFYIEDICSQIDEFLKLDAEELAIERCNAFIRRLVYQEAKIRWPKKVRVETKTDVGAQTILVYKMGTKEEEKRREAERREEELKEIKEAAGITALFRKIADSGKPIVGHNMLLDLLHMINQFFGPPPDGYKHFKSLIHGLFPRLLDVKVICQNRKFKELVPSSILDAVLDRVGKEPFSLPEVEPVEDRSYSLNASNYHEAGYDAFVTGLCFIALANYLDSSEPDKRRSVLPDSPLLKPFLNKLLMPRLKDIEYISLDGSDPIPNRDHVFHLTFPKKWKLNDITQLFSPFGGVFVSWLSDETAYVALNRRDQASSLIDKLAKDERMRLCKIRTHEKHNKSVTQPGEDGSKTKSTDTKTKDKRKHENSGNDDGSWQTSAAGKKRRKRKGGATSGDNASKGKPFGENASWE